MISYVEDAAVIGISNIPLPLAPPLLLPYINEQRKYKGISGSNMRSVGDLLLGQQPYPSQNRKAMLFAGLLTGLASLH